MAPSGVRFGYQLFVEVQSKFVKERGKANTWHRVTNNRDHHFIHVQIDDWKPPGEQAAGRTIADGHI